MKRFLVFLCAMLLVFGIVPNVKADSILDFDKLVGSDTISFYEEITIQDPAEVYYWYSATNIAEVVIDEVTVVDDLLGPIFTFIDLAPGENYTMIQPVFIGFDTTNTATFTVAISDYGIFGDFVAQYSDSATVLVNNPIPEPATMLLLGSGLVGLAGFGRKKFKK